MKIQNAATGELNKKKKQKKPSISFYVQEHVDVFLSEHDRIFE
jgi:hypothetical protein